MVVEVADVVVSVTPLRNVDVPKPNNVILWPPPVHSELLTVSVSWLLAIE